MQPKRDLGYNPIFQISFNLQSAPFQAELPGIDVETLFVDNGTSKFDVSFELWETAEGISGRVEYSSDLFDPDAIRRILARYETLLEGIVAHPDRVISKLPLLTPEEKHRVLVEWNDTACDETVDISVVDAIQRQVERVPDAIAVVLAGDRLTYRELNQRANQLARYLRRRGVGPGVRVGICIERSLEMVVGLLGILKAGGAYVPLDPDYPHDRLWFMVSDSELQVILTRSALVGRLPGDGGTMICVDSDWPAIGRESVENLSGTPAPDSPAYVIYTSGSTGTPKGVCIAHSNVAQSTWARLSYYKEPIRSFLLLSTFSLDSSVAGIFLDAVAGRQAVPARRGEVPRRLVHPRSRCGVRSLASALCAFASSAPPGRSSGEAVEPRHGHRGRRGVPGGARAPAPRVAPRDAALQRVRPHRGDGLVYGLRLLE